MTTDVLLLSPDPGLVTDEAVLPPALAGLLSRLAAVPSYDPIASALVDQAVEVLRRPGFDTLLSLPQLAFEPFDYQRETASTVLRRMRGRAILADEVGLGKTIEAGLILSELRLRGWALLPNFRPYAPRGKCPRAFESPAHRLNGKRYHEHWLHNLMVSTSLMGFRNPKPAIR